MDGRRVSCPRGRVIGGSSSINGMVYIRGHAKDYDGWAAARGLEAWSYAHCLPYFKRSETRLKGADDYHGGDGPLYVTTGEMKNPLYRAFIEAGRQAGYATTDDMNGYRQEGLGPMDRTTYRGRRWSAAMAYLRPATDAAQSAGRAAVPRHPRRVRGHARRRRRVPAQRAARDDARAPRGDRVRRRDQFAADPAAVRHRRCHAARASSASTSVADVPGVGANLQDHLETYVQHACTQPITLYSTQNLVAMGAIGLEWLLLRKGLGATNHFESGGFIRSRAGVEHPDLQYHFLPIAISYDGKDKVEPARLPGARGSDAADLARHGDARVGESARPAAHPVQLPRDRGRPPGVPRRDPPHARDLRAEGVRPVPRRRSSRPAPPSRPTPRSTPTSGARPRARTTRRAPARWAPTTIRWRWSTASSACAAPRACASSTRRSCRRRERQPQRADDHDRREGRRHHSRPDAAAAAGRSGVRPSGMADEAALNRTPADRTSP